MAAFSRPVEDTVIRRLALMRLLKAAIARASGLAVTAKMEKAEMDKDATYIPNNLEL